MSSFCFVPSSHAGSIDDGLRSWLQQSQPAFQVLLDHLLALHLTVVAIHPACNPATISCAGKAYYRKHCCQVLRFQLLLSYCFQVLLCLLLLSTAVNLLMVTVVILIYSERCFVNYGVVVCTVLQCDGVVVCTVLQCYGVMVLTVLRCDGVVV
jgi:hypothetical protein